MYRGHLRAHVGVVRKGGETGVIQLMGERDLNEVEDLKTSYNRTDYVRIVTLVVSGVQLLRQ
jgi:hypothetical protein